MTVAEKTKRLNDFCLMTGISLDPTIFKMWVGLPDRAFCKKINEWTDWFLVGGRMEF